MSGGGRTAPARGLGASPANRRTRVGVFGGTFDPVHYGHLRSVEEAREILDLDRILLVPAADPPHKQRRPITLATHREAMLRGAIRSHRVFQVSTVEIDRPGVSFTIDTLGQLQRQHPSWQITLVMGIDAFADIATWKNHAAIFDEVDIAVLSRPPQIVRNPRTVLPVAVREDFRYASDHRSLVNRTGKRVQFLTVSALDISATDIRDRVRRGRSIRFLVPSSVERYIERERLYRAGKAST